MNKFVSFTGLTVVLLLVAYVSASAIRSSQDLIHAEDSCAGRCNQTGTIPGAPCQCNKPCQRFGDCCPDYFDLCTSDVPDAHLEALAEELILMDVTNNATQLIQVNPQVKVRQEENADRCPAALLTVAPEAFSRSTISKLRKLQNNYNADVTVRESFTQEEIEEMNDFIDAVFNTPIMQKAQEFLVAKNLPNGKDNFFTLWFQLYNRGGQTNSSSGFEHVFVGELDGGVSGFHNWESFTSEEMEGRLNYFGYMDYVDFGPRGSVIEHKFSWTGATKPISSMFIGTSPEFELAVYTVCFHARKDAKCPISINGQKIKIQTYTLNSSRGVHVGTAYPDLSDNE